MYRAIGENSYRPVEFGCQSDSDCASGEKCVGGECSPHVVMPEITIDGSPPAPHTPAEFVHIGKPKPLAIPLVLLGAIVGGAAFFYGTRS